MSQVFAVVNSQVVANSGSGSMGEISSSLSVIYRDLKFRIPEIKPVLILLPQECSKYDFFSLDDIKSPAFYAHKIKSSLQKAGFECEIGNYSQYQSLEEMLISNSQKAVIAVRDMQCDMPPAKSNLYDSYNPFKLRIYEITKDELTRNLNFTKVKSLQVITSQASTNSKTRNSDSIVTCSISGARSRFDKNPNGPFSHEEFIDLFAGGYVRPPSLSQSVDLIYDVMMHAQKKDYTNFRKDVLSLLNTGFYSKTKCLWVPDGVFAYEDKKVLSYDELTSSLCDESDGVRYNENHSVRFAPRKNWRFVLGPVDYQMAETNTVVRAMVGDIGSTKLDYITRFVVNNISYRSSTQRPLCMLYGIDPLTVKSSEGVTTFTSIGVENGRLAINDILVKPQSKKYVLGVKGVR